MPNESTNWYEGCDNGYEEQEYNDFERFSDDAIDWDPVGDEDYEDEPLFGEYPRCQMICSIGCEHWGGDALCLLELKEMEATDRYYRHQKWYDFLGRIQRVYYRIKDFCINIWLRIFHPEEIKTMDDLPF